MTWRMLDLFSGIGGFSLAAQWVWGDDLEIVAFCEINKFCQKVLHKHWPNVPIIENVRDVQNANSSVNGKSKTEGRQAIDRNIKSTSPIWHSSIDLLTGGFPCQPFSCAGKRKGKEDDRFLWPEMFRVIKEIRPRWIVAENVAGIVRMELDNCLSDLEGEGYSTGTVIIPACAVNAPHRRDRVWIVAYNEKQRNRYESARTRNTWSKLHSERRKGMGLQPNNSSQDVADNGSGNTQQRDASTQGSSQCFIKKGKAKSSGTIGRQNICEGIGKAGNFGSANIQGDWWSIEPDVGRVAHGIPSRVDRLKSLGNAIVPQVAYQIMRAIRMVENI